LPHSTQSLVSDGAVGWNKLQSVYGLARSLGATDGEGWTAQGVATIGCAAAIVWLWRSRAPSDLKAAALAVSAMLATPYVFAYDLPALTVAAAFLYRHRRFDALDYLALAISAAAMIALPFMHLPTGLLVSLAVAAAVARRCRAVLGDSAPLDTKTQPAFRLTALR
jgi:arabinofuranan 3-O-arabinosyltransferase